MILGIGTDIIEIKRFANWHSYSFSFLLKFFSSQEIEYCLQIPAKTAERFAARFAAKEAFFKAFSSYRSHSFTLRTLCKAVQVIVSADQIPSLQIDWQSLLSPSNTSAPTVHLSLSHSKTAATAFVILEEN